MATIISSNKKTMLYDIVYIQSHVLQYIANAYFILNILVIALYAIWGIEYSKPIELN